MNHAVINEDYGVIYIIERKNVGPSTLIYVPKSIFLTHKSNLTVEPLLNVLTSLFEFTMEPLCIVW